MNTADQNFRLLQEIEANRRFLLMAYEQNPSLLANAEPRIRQLFESASTVVKGNACSSSAAKQRGVSLIELIMFIVIVSTALAGILSVMNITTRSSADPLVHKQALAIAESLLEEVELMPFTFCDPDDADASTAAAPVVGAGGCAATVEGGGPEAGEARYSAVTPFDNVNDYNGFAMGAGATLDITGTNTGVAGYAAAVAVAPVVLAGVAAGDALRIIVTVTGPDAVPVVVEGIRTRYAPRALP
jgi:MSHA pilin protein MshD